jgi:hypothetical protein
MGFSVDGIFVKGTLLALGGAKALAIKSDNAWGDIRCSIKSTQSLLIAYLLGIFGCKAIKIKTQTFIQFL